MQIEPVQTSAKSTIISYEYFVLLSSQ